MKGIVVVPAAAALTWVLAPVVDLALRGTIDSRTRAGWRAEARRGPAVEPPTIPAPRTPLTSTRPAVPA